MPSRPRSSSVTFSRRSEFEARPNRFSEALAEAQKSERELFDLSVTNPAQVGLGLSGERLLELLSNAGVASYTPEPFGLRSARAAMTDELARQGIEAEVEQIVLSASTSEAYGFLFKLLCDPGDCVLVPEPSYPLLQVLARLEEVLLVPYQLSYDGEWHVDRASLAKALSAAPQRPKALLVVHPNNPTGSFLQREELYALATLGLPIISDEVFGEYAFEASATRATSALEVAEQVLVFRLSGLSKSLALPQLKLACTVVAGPASLVRTACARLEHIADASLSLATPVQLALPALLSEGPALRAAIRQRVLTNRAALTAALCGSSASVLRSEGGWYAIVRLPATQDDEAWCLRLLDEHRVVVQPGYFYDLAEGVFMVLSCLAEVARFAEGARRLRALLDRSLTDDVHDHGA